MPKADNRQGSFRTIGLVGLGNIGREFARLVAVLSPRRLLAYDPVVSDGIAASVGATRVDLGTLLQEAEAVVLMAMANPANRHLLGARELDLLRPGALLINVARAHLVDYAALVRRLQDPRRPLRAALDVFDPEPLAASSVDEVAAALRSLPNVILTPRRAGGTQEAYAQIGADFVFDLERFVRGQPPQRGAIVDEAIAVRQGLV